MNDTNEPRILGNANPSNHPLVTDNKPTPLDTSVSSGPFALGELVVKRDEKAIPHNEIFVVCAVTITAQLWGLTYNYTISNAENKYQSFQSEGNLQRLTEVSNMSGTDIPNHALLTISNLIRELVAQAS